MKRNPTARLTLEYFIQQIHRRYPEMGRDNIHSGISEHPRMKAFGFSRSAVRKAMMRLDIRAESRGGMGCHDGWKTVKRYSPDPKTVKIW